MKKRTVYILAGPACFLLTGLLLGGSFGSSAALAVGLILWMGLWWITRPVHIAVTALLPIPVNALFSLVPAAQLISQYFSEIIVLLLGADFICQTWGRTGLDKRLAVSALCCIGPATRQQIAVWLTASAALSVFLPNVVVAAIFVPVALAMLEFEGEHVKSSHIAQAVLLAIVWGAGIGGFGSPLGGSANLVAISYLESILGREFMYVEWLGRFLPLLALVLLLNLAVLLRLPLEKEQLPGSRRYFRELLRGLGPMSRGEKLGLSLFLTAMLFSFLRPLYAQAAPGLRPAYVFFTCGLLPFFLEGDKAKHRPLLAWNEAAKNTGWGLIFLFAGGLALGRLVTATGAAAQLAKCITALPLSGGPETVFVFTGFATLLTEISSNTAAASIAIPVVESIARELALDPLPYVLLSIVAVNCAYVLPVSVRAIPIAYGLDPHVMFRSGLLLTLANILLTTAAGCLLLRFLPAFGRL